VLVAFIVLLSLHRISLQRLVLPLPPWLRWAGFALGLASLGLWYWMHLALGRFWSPQVQLRAVHRLVTSGPYSRMRHPMYTAIPGWAVSLGFMIASWVPVLFAAWAAAIFVMRVPQEERMMLEQFGDEYREYMKWTGRFLPRWQTPRHAAITAL
jgi:protein-S-isoprenylcysteine O-methyltransferase Ste14